jgi:WXG100 family type VII secretion target
MALTQVGIEGMVAAEANFQEALSLADTEASKVDGVGKELTGTWTGEASNVYQGALTEWQTNWQACRRALQQMQQTLEQTTKQYNLTHEETTAAAQQAKATMGDAFPGLPNF